MQTISAVINDLPDDKFDKYTYVFIKTRTPNFYRLMFKYKSDNTEFESCIEEVISSFQYFSPSGKTSAPTGFEPVIPAQWTKETTGLYKKIQNTDSLYWGIFTQDIFDMGIKKTIPALEKKLNYKFPVILCYLQLGSEFPLEFMNKNYRENRLAELTLQTTFSNNERLFGYTPFLDIYRGKKDEQIRTFARKAQEFGRPFLFRLNNEPNSDWTSYSAVVAMSDRTYMWIIGEGFTVSLKKKGLTMQSGFSIPTTEATRPATGTILPPFIPAMSTFILSE